MSVNGIYKMIPFNTDNNCNCYMNYMIMGTSFCSNETEYIHGILTLDIFKRSENTSL